MRMVYKVVSKKNQPAMAEAKCPKCGLPRSLCLC